MHPFDKKRAGTILGEGAAVLVIEDLESAIKRNAPIYAEIMGIKSLYWPYEMFQYEPNGSGMMKAMAGALDN